MADIPPRQGPVPSEEPEHELSADAYEATVPTRLTGFRGTNPVAFVLGGAIAFAIILLAGLAFLHRGSSQRVTTTTTTADVQPAAPGVNAGGGLQTPFVPEATPVPTSVRTPTPLFRLPPRLTTLPAPVGAPILAAASLGGPPVFPAQSVAQVSAASKAPLVPAPATQTQNTGQMKVDQPSPPPNPGQTAASETTKYVPVYRNGRLVGVVPVVSTAPPASASTAASSAQQQQPDTAQGSASTNSSGQFVSNGRTSSDTTLGAGNTGLLEARKFARDQDTSSVGYVRPQTKRQLATATVINARLLTKIESDLPGPVIAQVTQPVYDSATHTIVVIPSGAKVFGRYDEETVATSARLLMAFTRIIFPDGQEFDIGGLPGSSVEGTAGFGGDVDKHRGALYTSALLLSVLAGAESAISPQTNNGGLNGNNTSIGTQVQSAAGAELSQVGNKILNQAVDRPATIIIRPPYAFQIIVTHDLPLDEYVTQHR